MNSNPRNGARLALIVAAFIAINKLPGHIILVMAAFIAGAVLIGLCELK